MRRSSEKFYNNFSDFYPLVNFFLRKQKRVLFKKINALPAGSLLEIGVGNGRHLSKYRKHEITGVDNSEAMLKAAKRFNPKLTTLLQMNGEELSFKANTFDYIVLSHILSVTPHPNSLVSEAHRVLKPNGQLFILNHFTPNNALKYLDKGFQRFSSWFHFKSFFTPDQVQELNKFHKTSSIAIGPFSYYKLLTFSKVE